MEVGSNYAKIEIFICSRSPLPLPNVICRYTNLEITSFSRLSSSGTTLDCLNKCRVNQDCYSFNYDKAKKWCYISISEKSDLVIRSDAKYAAGYRKCVEHADNNGWDNPEFSGGLQ